MKVHVVSKWGRVSCIRNYIQPDLSRDTTCPNGKCVISENWDGFQEYYSKLSFEMIRKGIVQSKAFAPDKILKF